MKWTGERYAFNVETFIQTNEFVTATRRAFRVHLKLSRHDPVRTRNSATGGFDIWGSYAFEEDNVAMTELRLILCDARDFSETPKDLTVEMFGFNRMGATSLTSRCAIILRALFSGHLISLHLDR